MSKGRVYVIGCGVLGPEVKSIANQLNLDVELILLPGRLHNTPDLLRNKLQDAIDEASAEADCLRIIIAYGLCGNGTIGIESRNVCLVLPKVHDCISLFLGGNKVYQEQFAQYPGTFYITEGWREEKETQKEQDGEAVWVGDESLGCREILNNYGEGNGRTIVDFFTSWRGNYQRAAYIDTGVGSRDKSRLYAEKLAKDHNWKFDLIKGDLGLLEKLLCATESSDEVLFVPPFYRTLYSSPASTITSAAIQDWEGRDLSGPRHLVFGEEAQSESGVFNYTYGLGLDAGGTYTDGVIYNFITGDIVSKSKALTTRWDYSQGINNCLNQLDKELLEKVELVSVSTTLATNAIVEGHGQKTGLILMDCGGLSSGGLVKHSPKRFIKGRINIQGQVVETVDEQEVRRVVKEMVENDEVTAFAVSGYCGSINPEHEVLVRDIIKQEVNMTVCCGHELSGELNFIIRAQTAVVNGRIIPRMIQLFGKLEYVLEQRNIDAPVMVVKGDGTLMAKSMAIERPVETILSGPAASVAGAKHLTGMKDAMVVDIGGTTTDSGDIVDGNVAICEKGAVVGAVTTHVKALRMKTFGLGGDSHIKWENGCFALGPQRVAPLVWAGEMFGDGISRVLDEFFRHGVRKTQQIILVAMQGEFQFTANDTEEEIYNLLDEQPLSPEQLAKKLDILSYKLLPLSRLEESGLVQRVGLTPTDILHINGAYVLWSRTPAVRMMEIISLALQKDSERLVEQLLDLVTNRISTELVKHGVFGDFAEEELAGSPVYTHFIDSILSKAKERFMVDVSFQHPVIGIGAPASSFLPKVEELLSVKVVVPENGDVANALGAITSHVLVSQRVSLRTNDTGMFIVEGVTGTPAFEKIEDAEKWAVDHLLMGLRQKAKDAGTSQQVVDIKIDDRLVNLADGNSLFLERIIVGSLTGKPDMKCREYSTQY